MGTSQVNSANTVSKYALLNDRNCKGKQCTLKIEPGPGSCVIHSFEADYKPENTTRKEFCGFTPDYITPGTTINVPHSENGNCFWGLPVEIEYKARLMCIDGKAQFTTQLSFPTAIIEKYTCMHNVICTENTYRSNFVCYTHGASAGAEESSSDGTRHQLLSILIAGLAAWILLLS